MGISQQLCPRAQAKSNWSRLFTNNDKKETSKLEPFSVLSDMRP